jgi:putative glutamine amidotransferase
VEGVEADGRRFCLAVQWHPETSEDRRLFSGLVAAAG